MRQLRAVVAALGLACAVVTGCAVPSGTSGDTGAAARESGPGAARPAEPAPRVGSVVPEAPTSMVLQDGVRVPIRAVSTTDKGVLDVPEDIRAAGWWRGGSRIGDPFGSTLVAAHVDSATQGLGPFAVLLEVRPGQRLTVLTDSLEQTFVVRSLRLRPRGSIGPRSWLHSPAGPRRLILVTCASPFVPALGGYQNLAVVVAEPVGGPRAQVAA